MPAFILDGKKLAEKIKTELKEKIAKLNEKPGLAVILVGNNPASELYVNKKEKTCQELGIHSFKYQLKEDISEEEIIALIKKLNEDDKINGILIQLPLPPHLNKNKILELINPKKDVDGLTSESLGKIILGDESFAPCTPKGIIRLLEEYKIPTKGKNIIIINHSNIVGKPLATMLLNRDATVTICHKFTKNLNEHTRNADILISGVGKAKLITEEIVKEEVVIIDVGISKINGKICGDVDFKKVQEKASYITPVPNGVGPMTIAMLMENTLNTINNKK